MPHTTFDPADADVDLLLERYDRTDPALQRRIIVQMVSDALRYRDERDAVLAAAKTVLVGLDARLQAASDAGEPVPVFSGIAALHGVVARIEGRRPSPITTSRT